MSVCVCVCLSVCVCVCVSVCVCVFTRVQRDVYPTRSLEKKSKWQGFLSCRAAAFSIDFHIDFDLSGYGGFLLISTIDFMWFQITMI